MSDVASLPGARQRGREPFPCFYPETESEFAQPRVDPAGFEHGAKQRSVGSRKNPGDLRREVIRRKRIERAYSVLMLFVHEEPHEVRFVGELVVERADADSCRLADLVNGGAVTVLPKCRPRGGEKTSALFLRAPLRPCGRSVGQTNNV